MVSKKENQTGLHPENPDQFLLSQERSETIEKGQSRPEQDTDPVLKYTQGLSRLLPQLLDTLVAFRDLKAQPFQNADQVEESSGPEQDSSLLKLNLEKSRQALDVQKNHFNEKAQVVLASLDQIKKHNCTTVEQTQEALRLIDGAIGQEKLLHIAYDEVARGLALIISQEHQLGDTILRENGFSSIEELENQIAQSAARHQSISKNHPSWRYFSKKRELEKARQEAWRLKKLKDTVSRMDATYSDYLESQAWQEFYKLEETRREIIKTIQEIFVKTRVELNNQLDNTEARIQERKEHLSITQEEQEQIAEEIINLVILPEIEKKQEGTLPQTELVTAEAIDLCRRSILYQLDRLASGDRVDPSQFCENHLEEIIRIMESSFEVGYTTEFFVQLDWASEVMAVHDLVHNTSEYTHLREFRKLNEYFDSLNHIADLPHFSSRRDNPVVSLVKKIDLLSSPIFTQIFEDRGTSTPSFPITSQILKIEKETISGARKVLEAELYDELVRNETSKEDSQTTANKLINLKNSSYAHFVILALSQLNHLQSLRSYCESFSEQELAQFEKLPGLRELIEMQKRINLSEIRETYVENSQYAEDNLEKLASYIIEHGDLAEGVFAFKHSVRKNPQITERNLHTLIVKAGQRQNLAKAWLFGKMVSRSLERSSGEIEDVLLKDLDLVLKSPAIGSYGIISKVFLRACENGQILSQDQTEKIGEELRFDSEKVSAIFHAINRTKTSGFLGKTALSEGEADTWLQLGLKIAEIGEDESLEFIQFFCQSKEYGQTLSVDDLPDIIPLLEIKDKIFDASNIGLSKLDQVTDKRSWLNNIFVFLQHAGHKQEYDKALFFIANAPSSVDKPDLHQFLINRFDKLKQLPDPEKNIEPYIELFNKISVSPSQEIQRIKDQLLDSLLEADSFEAAVSACNDIISIFEKNNLPLAGKIFLVFEAIFARTPANFRHKIEGSFSPILKENAYAISNKAVIWGDLIRIHLLSGNRSLKNYLEILRDGQEIFDKAEKNGFDSLSPDERTQLNFVLNKLEVIYRKSLLGIRSKDNSAQNSTNQGLQERYLSLKHSLRVRSGQTIKSRISEMFLKPLGLNSLEDALSLMKQAKISAHKRNLEVYAQYETLGADSLIKPGDLLKGVPSQYFESTIQNGSVAKEYLGAASNQDSTWLDTDLAMVLPADAELGFKGALSSSLAKDYGDIKFCIKQGGNIAPTEVARTDHSKFELFKTGVVDENRHYGVRTGFPSTEISLIIADVDSTRLENIFYSIAQNGYYIPVVDSLGHIVFTPQKFEEYRKTFDGIDRFEGDPFEFHSISLENLNAQASTEIRQMAGTLLREKDQERGATQQLSRAIYQTISSVLASHGVELKSSFDTGMIGAELMNIGSSGRNTNLPNDFDFDLTLMLDNPDFKLTPEIVAEVRAALGQPEDKGSHQEGDDYFQLRLSGIKSINGVAITEIIGLSDLDSSDQAGIELDLGIKKKSSLIEYGSHQAVEDKLKFIADNYGESAYREAVINILLAKQILKQGHAYKRVEDGGFGGIGTENWILLNHGSLIEAFRSFAKAASDGAGKIIDFQQFKSRYKIYNPAINLKRGFHDNYILNMTEDGYQKMAETVIGWLNDHNIS